MEASTPLKSAIKKEAVDVGCGTTPSLN
jgi:hypothetical protein